MTLLHIYVYILKLFKINEKSSRNKNNAIFEKKAILKNKFLIKLNNSI